MKTTQLNEKEAYTSLHDYLNLNLEDPFISQGIYPIRFFYIIYFVQGSCPLNGL